jgi:hypothetical protein
MRYLSRQILRAVFTACGLLISAAPLCAEQPHAAAHDIEFFEAKIRPILVAHCYECHSGSQDEVQGGLAVDYREGLVAGGDSGPAVIPGDPDGSLLLAALRYESLEMPPTGRLPDEVVEQFREWIQRGAHDPRVLESEIAAERRGQPRQVDLEQGRQFWSYQPLDRAAAPEVVQREWPDHWIDAFILDRLEQEGLQPAAEIDRSRLLRRLTFDLTGLPPTLEQHEAFLADSSPIALARVVDQLLASPRFGEHWGRHWLDVARYADSNGSDFNATFHNAWRYRNYVIAGMNRDKPYDQFIREQLAGDLLPYDSDEQRAEQLIGTGFLMIGAKMLSERDKIKLRMDVVDEQVDTIGRVFLGMTLGCARCHDHKFDPIPTADYYALAGILKSTKTLEGEIQQYVSNWVRQPLLISPEHARQLAQFEAAQRQLEKTRRELQVELKRTEELLGKLSPNDVASAVSATGGIPASPPGQITPDVSDRNDSPSSSDSAEALHATAARLRDQLAKVEDASKELAAQAPPPAPLALAVQEAEDIGDCQIRIRGEPHQLGPSVPRGFLQVVTPDDSPLPTVPPSASGRQELADWIAHPANPLTARVLVNRIWQKLMGEGLVRTVDNFGLLGQSPTHPELLDRLAGEFIDHDWSVKHVVRQIVLSRVYRMDSTHRPAAFERDPENRLWWRGARRRLTAESIRDALLAVGDQLDLTVGEAPVAHLGTLVTQNRPDSVAAATEESLQRTVYQPVIRGELSPLLTVFDFADPDLVVGQRPVTTTPAQPLLLLNSPLVQRQVQRIAERLEVEEASGSDGGDDQVSRRLSRLYGWLFGRLPTAEELQHGREVLREWSLGELDRGVPGTPSREANTGEETLGGNELDASHESGRQPFRPSGVAWRQFIHAMVASTEFRMVD